MILQIWQDFKLILITRNYIVLIKSIYIYAKIFDLLITT